MMLCIINKFICVNSPPSWGIAGFGFVCIVFFGFGWVFFGKISFSWLREEMIKVLAKSAVCFASCWWKIPSTLQCCYWFNLDSVNISSGAACCSISVGMSSRCRCSLLCGAALPRYRWWDSHWRGLCPRAARCRVATVQSERQGQAPTQSMAVRKGTVSSVSLRMLLPGDRLPPLLGTPQGGAGTTLC